MAARMLQRLVGSSVDQASPSLTSAAGAKADKPRPPPYTNPSSSNLATGSKAPMEGGQLFELFVLDQISKNMITSPRLQDFCARPLDRTQELCETAKRLGDLATAFSQTEDRQRVKTAALTVSSHRMRQELTAMLEVMLTECADMDEGIIVLFFFCLDLSVRILETEHGQVLEVMTWCQAAIDTALGPYVQAHGGWAEVGKSTAKMFVAGFSLLGQLRGLMSV